VLQEAFDLRYAEGDDGIELACQDQGFVLTQARDIGYCSPKPGSLDYEKDKHLGFHIDNATEESLLTHYSHALLGSAVIPILMSAVGQFVLKISLKDEASGLQGQLIQLNDVMFTITSEFSLCEMGSDLVSKSLPGSIMAFWRFCTKQDGTKSAKLESISFGNSLLERLYFNSSFDSIIIKESELLRWIDEATKEESVKSHVFSLL
jgi:hypothetical protein